MYKLSVMVNFSSEIGIVFSRGFKNDLRHHSVSVIRETVWDAHLGSIGEVMLCQVHLSERTLSNQSAQCIVSNMSQVLCRELPMLFLSIQWVVWDV